VPPFAGTDSGGDGAASASGVPPTPSGRDANVANPPDVSWLAPIPNATSAQMHVRIRIVVQARRRVRACCCFSGRGRGLIASVDRLLDEGGLALVGQLTDDRSESGDEGRDERQCEHTAEDSVLVLAP
jgi:hypothetical protein